MKKTILYLIMLIIILVLLNSCNGSDKYITTVAQDVQFLQEKYPESTIYPIEAARHIVIDSDAVYDIKMNNDGTIQSCIKIK